MKHLDVFKLVFIFCLATTFSQSKPNILFIFTDDQGWNDVGFNGNTEVKTPHLDQLANSGTVFTHAYNSGSWSGAVCIASRTMMMTGRQLWEASKVWHSIDQGSIDAGIVVDTSKKLGKNTKGLGQYAKDNNFWSQVMQQGGYATYYVGKWHTAGGNLAKSIHNHTAFIKGGMPGQKNIRYNRTFVEGQASNWSPTDTSLGGFWAGGKHWSEVQADEAITFLNQAKNDTKPFMMTVAFSAPHDPRQAPQEYQDMYPYDQVNVPFNFVPEYPFAIGSNRIRDERLAPFPRTDFSVRVNRSEYYAAISHMDDQIGRILAQLKANGQDQDTYIIFTSDHGLAVGHHGFMGKQNMYDHSVRVPWCISGPTIPQNNRINTPIYLQDAMATCLDLGGITKPGYVDFNSVLPIVNGTATQTNQEVYSAFTNHQRMLIADDYKLIVYPQTGVELLYDLKNDPDEWTNLADNPLYLSQLNTLKTKLTQKMVDLNDPITLTDQSNYPYKGAPGNVAPVNVPNVLSTSKFSLQNGLTHSYADGVLQLNSNEEMSGALVKIYDASAKQVMETSVRQNQLNVETLTDGVYHVMMFKNGKRGLITFVKH